MTRLHHYTIQLVNIFTIPSLCEYAPTVGKILLAPIVLTHSFNSGKELCSLYGTLTMVTSTPQIFRFLTGKCNAGADVRDVSPQGNVCCCLEDDDDDEAELWHQPVGLKPNTFVILGGFPPQCLLLKRLMANTLSNILSYDNSPIRTTNKSWLIVMLLLLLSTTSSKSSMTMFNIFFLEVSNTTTRWSKWVDTPRNTFSLPIV